jgi:hypothetical protein
MVMGDVVAVAVVVAVIMAMVLYRSGRHAP